MIFLSLHFFFLLERFSNECRKTKTKVITLANQKGWRQSSKPIKTASVYFHFHYFLPPEPKLPSLTEELRSLCAYLSLPSDMTCLFHWSQDSACIGSSTISTAVKRSVLGFITTQGSRTFSRFWATVVLMTIVCSKLSRSSS